MHNMPLTILMVLSVQFSGSKHILLLYNCSFLEHFYHHNTVSIFSSFQPLVTSVQLSVFMNLAEYVKSCNICPYVAVYCLQVHPCSIVQMFFHLALK